MPSCCIIDCKNYSQKGFSLRPLPTDPTRKALWLSKINRNDWEPSKKWFICEMHFSEDMWEKPRVDGKRKLKHNAVPTIFNQSQIKGRKNEAFPPLFLPSDLISETYCQMETHQQDSNNEETHHKIQHSVNSTLESISLRNDCEQYTEINTNLTTQDTSKLSMIPCEETSETKLIKKLEEAELNARQAILKAEEANQKLQQANIILRRMNKSKWLLQKHVKRLNDEKKIVVKENLKLKSLLRLNNVFKIILSPNKKC